MERSLLAIGLTALGCYLLGSLNFAVIISKYILKDDVRTHGSGNAGFTNMMRVFGALPAAATLIGDFAKGAVAVLLGRLIFGWLEVPGYGDFLGAYSVMTGHVFPIFFGFKGGKAIASALGVLLALDPVIFGILVAVFVPIVPLTGYVSLASVSGAAALPVVLALVRRQQGRLDGIEVLLSALLAAGVIYLHRGNIKRLLSGTENKLLRKKILHREDEEDKTR
jgi:glycerol-3-phosphate acyltransferase PlsY